jgi:hypothetical protein
MSRKDFQNGFAFGLASGGVFEVFSSVKIEEIEKLINNSDIIDNIDRDIIDKIKILIEKAKTNTSDSETILDKDGIVIFDKSIDNQGIVLL